MYQREALWLRFTHELSACNAMKISVGGINALTGTSKHEGGQPGVQDYLCKSQPWLDGIVKEEGKVKQFVAMPIGQGYTIEEQLTGTVRGPALMSALRTCLSPMTSDFGGYSTDRHIPCFQARSRNQGS